MLNRDKLLICRRGIVHTLKLHIVVIRLLLKLHVIKVCNVSYVNLSIPLDKMSDCHSLIPYYVIPGQ